MTTTTCYQHHDFKEAVSNEVAIIGFLPQTTDHHHYAGVQILKDVDKLITAEVDIFLQILTAKLMKELLVSPLETIIS